MSTNSYVPPHMRNRQETTEQPTTMERKNPFQKERRAPRRPYEKPFWQIQQEKKQLELEEKKKEAEKGLEDTEENFPALQGSSAVVIPGSIWSGDRKFSELASEWKSTDDQQKEEEERRKNSTKNTSHDDVFQLPRFRNVHRFAEPEDEYSQEIDVLPPQPPSEEEWQVVNNRRYRKPKKEFDFSEESLQDFEENEEDGTVWGAPEEHETCWDERR